MSDILEICIMIEQMTGRIYKLLGDKAGSYDEKIFWHRLQASEENHATILQVGRAYHNIGELPEDFIPRSVPELNETVTRIHAIWDIVGNNYLSLKEACELSIEMEELVGEKCLQEALTRESDSATIKKLKRLLTDETLHVDRIREFMKERDVA